MRSPPNRERRLARVEAGLARDEPVEANRRCLLAARARVRAIIRDRLAGSGIDPADVRALHIADDAAAEPDGISEQQRPGMSEHRLIAKILGIAEQYQDGGAPDPARASLAELFAWCLAHRHGDEPAGKPE